MPAIPCFFYVLRLRVVVLGRGGEEREAGPRWRVGGRRGSEGRERWRKGMEMLFVRRKVVRYVGRLIVDGMGFS